MRRPLVFLLLAACRSAAADASPPIGSASPTPIAQSPLAAPTASVDPPDPGGTAHLLFVGDLSLTLGVGEAIARGEPDFPFGDVRPAIAAADLAMGNLECVVSTLGVPLAPVSFRAPAEAINALKETGFDAVSVANNHALDFGRAAYDDMVSRLAASGMPPIGSAVAERPAEPWVRTVHGVRVAVLGYYEVDWPRAYRDVERAKADGAVVVVFNHWGLEDVVEPTGAQRAFAHGLVDAGADLVVGAHAHVLQPEETYRGKLVVYGLGNFVFNGTACAPRRRVGGVLDVEIDANGVRSHGLRRVVLDVRGAPHWLPDGETPGSAGCSR